MILSGSVVQVNRLRWKRGSRRFQRSLCPTIALEGDANDAPHADPCTRTRKYAGKYEHRNIAGGIGNNLPQEAPEAFAQAVIDVDKA